MINHKVQLRWLLIFLTLMTILDGCYNPNLKKKELGAVIQENNETAATHDYYDFIIGIGDGIEINVYRKKTSESIIGIGDSISVIVYRNKPSEFNIGVGDNVKIDVFRHSDISRSAKIDHTGTIIIPLIGEVQAAGKSKTELRDEIKRKLSKYTVDPQVVVEVTSNQDLIQEDLSKTFKITEQKKGKIVFPLIGEVNAVGRDVLDLSSELERRLSKYMVDPKVEIEVSPLQEIKLEDFSLTTNVDNRGNIMLPLVGYVRAAGKSEPELEEEVTRKLSEYLINFQLSLRVSGIQSQKIHVLGEVQSPGTFILDQKMSVWEAIPKAGGFTHDANQKAVLLLRREKGIGRMTTLNIDELLTTGNLDQNIILKTGDIIYIPPTFIANFERFMIRFGNILSPVISLQHAIILWPDLIDALRGETDSQIIVSP